MMISSRSTTNAEVFVALSYDVGGILVNDLCIRFK